MGDVAIAAAIAYACLLFLIAFIYDSQDRPKWLISPLAYTLSISVYCTSWTFYGAVGSAARSGLEYLTIYLGPSLVFFGFWFVLRKLLAICARANITSLADFLSARYGKSDRVAALVTIIAVCAAAPYIALQIKAITLSLGVIENAASAASNDAPGYVRMDLSTAFWLTAGLALFTILFGTRSIDINERHYGVVAAIAVEAIVKLIALVVVGLLATTIIWKGGAEIAAASSQVLAAEQATFSARWIGITVLSGIAIICLPRQFQVTFVENENRAHLFTAAWAFPTYLLLISIFVLPIAIAGSAILPDGANPDMFVLTMPLASGDDTIALLAFLGGFSSGTSMVIVSCIALSTMISNHIMMPLALRSRLMPLKRGGDIARFLLNARRISVCLILAFGYLYLAAGSTGEALASIGLIAFVGAAQMFPALVAALYWRQATARGATLGLVIGFAIWAWTLLLPAVFAGQEFWEAIAAHGPMGIAALRPGAFLGLETLDPLIQATIWSLLLNSIGLVLGSLSRDATPLEQVQAAQFVDVFTSGEPPVARRGAARAESPLALFDLTQRVVGADRAYRIFRDFAQETGQRTEFPAVDDAFITHLERRMAASIGAASARAMIQRTIGSEEIGLDDLIRIADETARLMRHSTEIERKSSEIEEAARQLTLANEQLREIDRRKDEFLSQVSHELRTPMTSIRSFTEILTTEAALPDGERAKFTKIIHEESIRLTALLDEILAFNTDAAPHNIEAVDAERALDHALQSTLGLMKVNGVELETHRVERAQIFVDAEAARLEQVFINVLSNAVKYNTSSAPKIVVTSKIDGSMWRVVIADNGPGVPAEDRAIIFDKFARGRAVGDRPGAGLGLAISQALIKRFGGELRLLPTKTGAAFEITLPLNAQATS